MPQLIVIIIINFFSQYHPTHGGSCTDSNSEVELSTLFKMNYFAGGEGRVVQNLNALMPMAPQWAADMVSALV